MKKKKQIFVYFEAWKNELVCYIPTQSFLVCITLQKVEFAKKHMLTSVPQVVFSEGGREAGR